MKTELPVGWATCRVGDAGRVQLGRQRSPKYHSGAHMRPYLRVANVFEDRIDLSDVMEMHFEPAEARNYELHPYDILLNEGQSKELVGRPAMYRGELPGGCFTNSLVRFQASAAVDPTFALNLFRHWLHNGDFQAIAKITTNIAHLGAGRFADMEAPIPPLREQRRIVAKIEALQARSRRAREELEAIPPLLDKLRQSVLAAAFRSDLTADWRAAHPDVEPASVLLERIKAERRRRWEEAELAKMRAKGKEPKGDSWKSKYKEPEPVDTSGLPELPAGWCWASLAQLSWDSNYGTSTKCDYEGAGQPVLRIPNVLGERLRFDDLKLALEDLGLRADQYLAPNDMLIVRTNGSRTLVGRAAISMDSLEQPTYFASYLIRFRLLGDANLATWVLRAWHSPQNRSAILDFAASSAGQYNVSMGELTKVAIPIPPLAEVEALVDLLGKTLSLEGSLRGISAELTPQHESLDQSILAKAFRGELVPQDPNDEPTSVLLERIRAQREAARPKPKRRGRKTKAALAKVAAPEPELAPPPVIEESEPKGQLPLFEGEDFMAFDADAQVDAAHTGLLGAGAMLKEDAVRLAAGHLRELGLADFKRLRKDGHLYAAIEAAINRGVKVGAFDRPGRGKVRAIKPAAADYDREDWVRCLLAVVRDEPVDRDDAMRMAAEWAQETMGLAFVRLRSDGVIMTGLKSALNGAIRRGLVERVDSRRVLTSQVDSHGK